MITCFYTACWMAAGNDVNNDTFKTTRRDYTYTSFTRYSRLSDNRVERTATVQVAAWRSGNVVGRINEFTVRRARLVLGWVTVFGGQKADKPSRYFTKPPRPTQPPTLSGTGNEYQPKCGDALRLGSKGRYGSFHLWINVWVAVKSV